ncbi:MAG: prepilin-type N-terminal cleavage/methylation domain-containing protein [bacterium]|nr:prepilin-type N-terminal cleavage/methylation domain-containing protein [bacterium]
MFLPLPVVRNSKLLQRGFTLIELLIVAALIAILLAILLARLGTFGDQTRVATTAQRIISTLELARNQTLASESETVYGVHFESDKYVLFKGASYDPVSPDNKVINLSEVEINDVVVAGGSDVVFARIRGTTVNSGDIKIRLINDTSRTATILINSQGQASLNEFVSAPTARTTDTRHLHLDFGWSMASSNTLRLIFSDPPNPPVTRDIDISDNTNSGKFEWEDEVPVNASEQKLRIHSHSLTPNTILSIHRDRRFNDKALQVQVDGATVGTYDAAGNFTPGSISSYEIQ